MGFKKCAIFLINLSRQLLAPEEGYQWNMNPVRNRGRYSLDSYIIKRSSFTKNINGRRGQHFFVRVLFRTG